MDWVIDQPDNGAHLTKSDFISRYGTLPFTFSLGGRLGRWCYLHGYWCDMYSVYCNQPDESADGDTAPRPD